jgi:hypothetical protein
MISAQVFTAPLHTIFKYLLPHDVIDGFGCAVPGAIF